MVGVVVVGAVVRGRAGRGLGAAAERLPFAASCSWIYCFSSGEMELAVQPWLDPPPAPMDSTLIETPQTLAAMLIGICALIGMFALSILRSSARLLSTFERLTLTSEGTLETPSATALPALLTPSTADEAVLQAERKAARLALRRRLFYAWHGPLFVPPNAPKREIVSAAHWRRFALTD